MDKCPRCGAPMRNNVCQYCGYEAPNESKVSKEDNSINQQLTHVTTVYVNPVYSTRVSNKSKSVALILCIFLGMLGFHKFYVGKIGAGIGYLFTGGLLGIGWIIDIFKIAAGKFEDSNGRLLKN